ncbi:MAG: FAD-dependent oxidoreductase, partial [Acidimicrobiales bacterium]
MTTLLIGDRSGATEHPRAHVLTDRCAGCQECVVRCPTGALTMDHARWVAVADDERCVGCRQCVRTCPFSAITVTGPLVVPPRHVTVEHHPDPLELDVAEVRRGLGSWDEALAEAERCLACPDPTCVRGCPAHNDIPGFISAVRDRDLALAHDILRRTTVLPDVCARVCNQAAQCEGACTWSLAGGDPVAIGQLERFVTEWEAVPGPRTGGTASGDPDGQTSTDLSVGIVGSGPGGIGAAWPLLEAGASVTVYERDEVPGGLLRWGIPDFTLPDEVAGRAWQQLEAAGVDLRCQVEIDAVGLGDLLERHDAVIVAAGAGAPIRLPVPGGDLEGVVDATAFLTSAHSALGSDSAPGPAASVERWRAAMGVPAGDHGILGGTPHVLVLGAGNTAMDVARTARRLGLDATCVDWLDERFALARPDELAEARAEGVAIRFGRTVTRLEANGPRVGRALLTRTRQERPTEAPRVLSKEPPDVVEVDLVVMAMGYRVDPAYGALLEDGPVRRQATGLPDRQWAASGVLAGPAAASAPANRTPVGQLALGREVGIR